MNPAIWLVYKNLAQSRSESHIYDHSHGNTHSMCLWKKLTIKVIFERITSG